MILQVWELVLEMQGYVLHVAIQFPPLITENFLLTSSLQLRVFSQMNVFQLLCSPVNTGDSHALHEELQAEGRNEPLVQVWQRLWRSLAQGPCCTAVLCPSEETCGSGGRELHKPCRALGKALLQPLSAGSCPCSAICGTREEACLWEAREPRWGSTAAV